MRPAGKTEKAIRFGCGFILGLLFFGVSSIWFVIEDRDTYVVAILVAAIVFGLTAMQFGSAFWKALGRWFSWFN